MLKSEVIKAFLKAKARTDLAELYNKDMEVQVNVLQGRGQRIETGAPGTKSGIAFSDGIETWFNMRIPSKAMTEPVDNDSHMKFDLEEHVEGIGMTGWDWKNKLSRWVAYDFDAMMGHSEKHTKKLTDAQLQEIQKTVTDLPFVTIRRSTSGKGIHLYVMLEPVPTANHTEHAALARSILSYISGITGYPFTDKVDIAGGNMWVWHRKNYNQDKSLNDGLSLVRQGGLFPASKIPPNWRDHLAVITRKSNRVTPNFEGILPEIFEELSGQRSKVKLDEDHRKLIKWLDEKGYPGHWDQDNHMLTTHTYYLAEAHRELKFLGEFQTNSTGRGAGADINCFMFPIRGGAWAVRRFGNGTGEHKSWTQDGKSWTRCYFNRDTGLDDVARLYDAVELESGGYQFPTVEGCKAGLLKLGVTVSLNESFNRRIMRVRELRNDYKLAISFPQMEGDRSDDTDGWIAERKFWKRLYNNPRGGLPDEAISLGDYDDMVRHIISEAGEDLGWMVNTDDQGWRHEPINHVRLFLQGKGIGKKDIEIILGRAVSQAWLVVTKPFESEYPGDRQWNRSKARFRIIPTLDGEALSFPTWRRVLAHCGKSLDESISQHPWCKSNGVTTGADYIHLWLACLVKHPQQPLPYLGLYGPQDSGKSTLHEAFCQLILDGGYMDGALALLSGGGFNGELQGSILCTLEEVDLRKPAVYQRVKEWVTSAQIAVHIKGQTPYKAPNYTHWLHCVNERDYLPTFSGDTRLTVMFVDSIPDNEKIPKRDLWTMLQKEAPDFLAALLATDIPDSRDRLMLPVIRTADKEAAEFSSMTPVQQFLADKTFKVMGGHIAAEDILTAFQNWIGPEEALNWSKQKLGKEMPTEIPRGRISAKGPSDQRTYYGNISFNPDEAPTAKWYAGGVFMKRER